jgi:hypothetical protein
MSTAQPDTAGTVAAGHPSLSAAHRRTLDAIFRHPVAHNLEWNDVVGLIGVIGEAQGKADNEFVFAVAGKRHLVHRPHTKDLTSEAVIDLRTFLIQAGASPEPPLEPPADADPAAPNLLIVVDHHGAKIFHVDVASADPSAHGIKPYDPHHFLHHLMHKDQSRERGQRAPEEPAYYAEIAAAVAQGGRIVLVGHGAGKSNAAHHLTEYLKLHHHETYQRIVREIDADLSSITTPQLLGIARQALQP